MSSMVFLTLIIVVVSGLIAYIGDLIGRKMGRKRLTLFGLRPRYTAIVISVFMGMLIAALTLTVTFAVSRRVRDAFFTPLDKLRDQITSLNGQLDENKSKLANSNKQRMEIEEELVKEQERLNGVQKQLKDGQQKLGKVQDQLAKTDARLKESQKSLQDTSKALIGTSQELIRSSSELLKVKADLERARAESDLLSASWGQFAFAPLAFQSGDEILSGTFSVTGTDIQRKLQLGKFLSQAEAVIRSRSPKMSKDDPALLFLRIEKNDRTTTLSQQDAIAAISRRIAATKNTEQAILHLATANNVPVNGPAIILVDRVEVFPNDQVFTKGTEVARVELTSGAQTTTADVLGALSDKLLRVSIPSALRAKEIAMIARRFDTDHPNAVPPVSPSLVSWSDLLAAAEQVRAQRGPVTVIARTRIALRRYDPIDLTLEVAPGGKP